MQPHWDSSELRRRALLALALVALAAYGVVLVRYSSRSAAAADVSGYLNCAKALSRGELVRPLAVSPDGMQAAFTTHPFTTRLDTLSFGNLDPSVPGSRILSPTVSGPKAPEGPRC